ncbi:hypothetical protein [Candidatus Vidania fulgoroideorum]
MKIKKKFIINFLSISELINRIQNNYNLCLKVFKNQIVFYFKNKYNKIFFIKKTKKKININYYFNFEKFKNLLKGINSQDNIYIKKKKKELLIKTKNFSYITKLKKNPKSKIKDLKLFNKIGSFIKINRKLFLEALENNLNTLKATNKESGINIIFKKNKILFYSTDGFRMSFFFFFYFFKKKFSVNLSKNSVLYIIKLLKLNLLEVFYIKITNNKLLVYLNKFFFVSEECRNISFNYNIINKKKFKKIKINHGVFYKTVNRIFLISSEKNNWLDIVLNKNTAKLLFNSNYSSYSENIKIKNKIKIKLRINIKYLLDFLKTPKSKFVYIFFKNKNKKLILKYKNYNYYYLIMPIYY